MSEHPTVTDVIEQVKQYRRQRRCTDCEETVSIRGFGGDHWWTCLGCGATGLGYPTRAAAITDLNERRV